VIAVSLEFDQVFYPVDILPLPSVVTDFKLIAQSPLPDAGQPFGNSLKTRPFLKTLEYLPPVLGFPTSHRRLKSLVGPCAQEPDQIAIPSPMIAEIFVPRPQVDQAVVTRFLGAGAEVIEILHPLLQREGLTCYSCFFRHDPTP
jgi:hypothetical protein